MSMYHGRGSGLRVAAAAALALALVLPCAPVGGQEAKPPGKKAKSPPLRDAAEVLGDAREALTGKEKDLPKARAILEDLLKFRTKDLSDLDRCHTFVYLGYIEDLEGHREEAVKWFTKAAAMKGEDLSGIRGVAELGLTKPVTWIKHLDENAGPARPKARGTGKVEKIGQATISEEQPSKNIKPDPDLPRKQFVENFDTLCQAIDQYYAFFEHKKIDWPRIVERYRPKVKAAADAEEFYSLLGQLVGELNDAHSWLCNHRAENTGRTSSPGLEIRRIEKQAVVVDVPKDSDAEQAGVKRGTVILTIDGRPVAERVADLRDRVGSFSSKRARTDEIYQRLLDGTKGVAAKLTCRLPGAKEPVTIELRRDRFGTAQPVPPTFPIKRGDFIWSGKHPSGYGYIRILSFDGRMEIADEFDRALEEIKDTPGLILDIRDNLGGFGTPQPRIVGRFISKRTKVSIDFVKNGKNHHDFAENATYFEPAGDWQYSKPLALLTNARTGSASDLFAAYLTSTGRPLTVGATTHGNLSGTGVYVTLPCNLVVRISNGYVCDGNGRIIEGQGTKPALPVEPTIADVIAGRDTVLERAVEALREKAGGPR